MLVELQNKIYPSKIDSSIFLCLLSETYARLEICLSFHHSLPSNGSIFNFVLLIFFKWFAVKTFQVRVFSSLHVNGRILFHCFYCSRGTIVYVSLLCRDILTNRRIHLEIKKKKKKGKMCPIWESQASQRENKRLPSRAVS